MKLSGQLPEHHLGKHASDFERCACAIDCCVRTYYLFYYLTVLILLISYLSSCACMWIDTTCTETLVVVTISWSGQVIEELQIS